MSKSSPKTRIRLMTKKVLFVLGIVLLHKFFFTLSEATPMAQMTPQYPDCSIRLPKGLL